MKLTVDADITRAETLPGAAYRSTELHARIIERVFAPSWQLAPDAARVRPGLIAPFTLLPGTLDAPLLLVRDGETLRCLSNVCTHRGALLCEEPCEATSLRCPYHGRRFALDGRLTHAPEFDGAVDFPGPRDHLPVVPTARFGPLVLTSLQPAHDAETLLGPVRARLAATAPALAASLDELALDPSSVRDYDVAASWMLYVDNYLEGLHIPFVHPSLAQALDFGAYRTELDARGVTQIGVARAGEDAFDGTNIAALYFWLFPNLMLNFYPWGLSLNVVMLAGVDAMRVHYRAYVADEARREAGAGSGLDRVEHEDEAIVESVQRGLQSRLYGRGRYSPSRETGVHHFHRLLCAALDEPLDGP